MDSARHRRISEVFTKAVDLDPSGIGAYLVVECAGDPDLRAEVESLLAFNRVASKVLPSGEGIGIGETLQEGVEASLAPEQIGSYRIIRRIGKGGMGVVYEAEQVDPIRRKVALKLIKLGMDTENVIARFESERQALAIMNHLNIAQVFDAGATTEGRPFFVMELVEGSPITEYCDERRASIQERLELLVQVCAGVQHAHQRGVIHRDIKPSNVLVTLQDDKPVPKIIDFGIAKAISPDPSLRRHDTELGQLVGTPEFMSPEQVDSVDHETTTRSDVYSLGVLLYVLISGVLPVEFSDSIKADKEALRRAMRETTSPLPPSRQVMEMGDDARPIAACRSAEPRALINRLRGDLDWIALKAIDREPSRRYPSPVDLAEDIQRHLRHVPVLAGPPGTAYRVRQFVRRHRIGVSVAALLVVTLTLAIAGTTIGLVRSLDAERATRLASEEAERASSQTRMADEVTAMLLDLFEVSDPSRAKGKTVTAREVLDRAASRMGGELQDQPQLRARLSETIGRVFVSLGLYGQALPLIQESVKLYESIANTDPVDLARSLDILGNLLKEKGENTAALDAYRQGLRIREKARPRSDLGIAISLHNMAAVLYEAGELRQARALNERALRIQEAGLPSDDPDLAASRLNLGLVLTDLGETAQAERFLEEAMATYEARDPDGLDLALALDGVAAIAAGEKKFPEAGRLFEQSSHIRERMLGLDHPALAISLVNSANVDLEMKLYEKALPLYTRAIAIWEKAGVGDHTYVAYARNNLAALLVEIGHYAEAKREHEMAVQIVTQHGGSDHSDIADFDDEYAARLRKAGRKVEAEEAEKEARRIRARSGSGNSRGGT